MPCCFLMVHSNKVLLSKKSPGKHGAQSLGSMQRILCSTFSKDFTCNNIDAVEPMMSGLASDSPCVSSSADRVHWSLWDYHIK